MNTLICRLFFLQVLMFEAYLQATVSYGLESQRSDATEIYEIKDDEEEDTTPLTDKQEKDLSFMRTCFKDRSRKVRIELQYSKLHL